jgi:hypothetical protein
MFFMIYPQMCLIILSTLYCKEFHDGSKWLVVDMNVRCDSPDIINSYIFKEMTFAQVQYVAGGCAVIYPIGVPLFFVGVLLWKRDTLFMSAHTEDKAEFERKILFSTRSAGVGETMDVLSERHNKDELNMAARMIQRWAKREMFYSMMTEVLRVVKTQNMCGTLYLNYEPQFFWWEALELIRKLILTGAIIFIMPETPTQLAVGCLITLAFMVLYSYAQPYEDIVDDVLQLLCQVAIFTNYFSGLLLMVKSEGATEAGFTQWLVLMNLAPIVFGLGFMGSFILVPLFRGIYDQYQYARGVLADTWNRVWIGTHRWWNTLIGRYFPSTRKVNPRFDTNVITVEAAVSHEEHTREELFNHEGICGPPIRIEDLDLTLAPIQAEIVAANSDPVAFGGVRRDANENLSELVGISPIRIEDLDSTLAPIQAGEVGKEEYPATNGAPQHPNLGLVARSFVDTPTLPSPIINYRENVPTLEQGRDEVKATQGAGPKFSNSLQPRSRLSLRSVLPRPSGPLGQRWGTLVNGSSNERNKDVSGGTTRGLFVVDI